MIPAILGTIASRTLPVPTDGEPYVAMTAQAPTAGNNPFPLNSGLWTAWDDKVDYDPHIWACVQIEIGNTGSTTETFHVSDLIVPARPYLQPYGVMWSGATGKVGDVPAVSIVNAGWFDGQSRTGVVLDQSKFYYPNTYPNSDHNWALPNVFMRNNDYGGANLTIGPGGKVLAAFFIRETETEGSLTEIMASQNPYVELTHNGVTTQVPILITVTASPTPAPAPSPAPAPAPSPAPAPPSGPTGASFGYVFRVPLTETTPVTFGRWGVFRALVDGVEHPVTISALQNEPFSAVIAEIQSQLPSDFDVRLMPITVSDRYKAILIIERLGATWQMLDGEAPPNQWQNTVFDYGLFYQYIDNGSEVSSLHLTDLPLASRTAPSADFTRITDPVVADEPAVFEPALTTAFIYEWVTSEGGWYSHVGQQTTHEETFAASGTLTLRIVNAHGEATSTMAVPVEG